MSQKETALLICHDHKSILRLHSVVMGSPLPRMDKNPWCKPQRLRAYSNPQLSLRQEDLTALEVNHPDDTPSTAAKRAAGMKLAVETGLQEKDTRRHCRGRLHARTVQGSSARACVRSHRCNVRSTESTLVLSPEETAFTIQLLVSRAAAL